MFVGHRTTGELGVHVAGIGLGGELASWIRGSAQMEANVEAVQVVEGLGGVAERSRERVQVAGPSQEGETRRCRGVGLATGWSGTGTNNFLGLWVSMEWRRTKSRKDRLEAGRQSWINRPGTHTKKSIHPSKFCTD